MTYREFAERTLFATDLATKLAGPTETLVDEDRGPAYGTPDAPGRPAELIPCGLGEGASRPRAHLLEENEDRVFLLHQFANHELLAAELMALAILKFPDAPAAFRKGLIRTLQEEQEHTRLYMRRLTELGVPFGSQPVNNYFWRCVADMETPLDYVSRLSLTFEQANLDFSQYFAGRFAKMGDTETACILEQIYKDELVHVGYGLHWFRRWRGQEVDEWQAFCQQLPFPLTPVRAKGNVPFNAAGRRAVGFTEDFILQLELWQHSRGRTPWLRFFNPGAEECAAKNDPHAARADAALTALGNDLDTIALFLSREDDLALLRREPRAEYLLGLRRSGVPLPEITVLGKNGEIPPSSTLLTRKIGRLRPWAWSADSVALLAPVRPQSAEPPGDLYTPSIRQLYAKTKSLELLASLEWQPSFGEPEIIGTACSDLASATASIHRIWAKGQAAVVKSSFSLAGRGMGIFPPQTSLQKLAKLVETPDGCVVEPFLDRVADFSAHYEIEPNQPPFLKGLVKLECHPSGKFTACESSPQFSRLLPSEVGRFCHEQGKTWFKLIYQELIPQALQAWLAETGYRGMLGIDAFFYRQPSGQIALKPVVEVNPRCTMGRLTLELRSLAAPATRVRFQIHSAKALKKQGITLQKAADLWQNQQPIILADDGKIRSGMLLVNDAQTATDFLGTASFFG